MESESRQESIAEILVIDDNVVNVRLLSDILTGMGYDVRKSLNGKVALNSIRISVPDLILLDIRMPEMDGYEVCKILKSDLKTCDIPIIFISASDDTWDKVKAFQVGGADYITKPFKNAEVLARVKNHLKIRSLQKELTDKNEKLMQVNEELERFTTAVSHDLQQPIQSILGFARLLEFSLKEEIKPEEYSYLQSILGAGERMKRLIQDLLVYAKMGQETMIVETIDCQYIVEQVQENLASAIAQRDVQITYASLPIVRGNEVQLIQLFQNLLNNAIKFTAPQMQPQIQIKAVIRKEKCLISVQDNGIGIPPDEKERVFQVFKRFHDSKDYSGHGIGLATCRKIVENHGGKIWFKSKVDEGTSFYFTLPIPEKNAKSLEGTE
ncbi:sensor histidine kinase [Roseofilum casamattae]|uniref:histidine kinase n=1 Tax=Roseofilum casamattae BLCC-M143 TaxID=3022442 RepID=A0ABT7C160_9CYAN|nr:ATP-binding protein [Roseofilum casamattae]MDJ1185187.1 ATP-binding protein [Roseofilum casamattae BLCC-M143]